MCEQRKIVVASGAGMSIRSFADFCCMKEEEVVEAAQKAFKLRERTSEYEKLKIISDYDALATTSQ